MEGGLVSRELGHVFVLHRVAAVLSLARVPDLLILFELHKVCLRESLCRIWAGQFVLRRIDDALLPQLALVTQGIDRVFHRTLFFEGRV